MGAIPDKGTSHRHVNIRISIRGSANDVADWVVKLMMGKSNIAPLNLDTVDFSICDQDNVFKVS